MRRRSSPLDRRRRRRRPDGGGGASPLLRLALRLSAASLLFQRKVGASETLGFAVDASAAFASSPSCVRRRPRPRLLLSPRFGGGRRRRETDDRRGDDEGAVPRASPSDDDYFGDRKSKEERLSELRDRATNEALVLAALCPGAPPPPLSSSDGSGSSSAGGRPLVELTLSGRGTIPAASSSGDDDDDASSSSVEEIPCLFLSPRADLEGEGGAPTTRVALPVPLPSSSYSRSLRLLSRAYESRPLSKSVLLSLNPLLINNDGGLYDNLPWAEWTVDPRRRNRDAADNPISEKFHFGKRDAYNRFMGKDWRGRSLSLGNVALRVKYMLEREGDDDGTDDDDEEEGKKGKGGEPDPKFDAKALAKRVLELEVRECETELAESERRVAVARTAAAGGRDDDGSTSSRETDDGEGSTSTADPTKDDDEDDVRRSGELREALDEASERRARLEEAQDALRSLLLDESDDPSSPSKPSASGKSLLTTLLDAIADFSTDGDDNAAPYRAATGYAPILDTKEDVEERSVLPYASPYDLMREVIEEQLNADVIGTALENASLFEGSLVLGGALILRRRDAIRKVRLNGEEVEVRDEEDDKGNDGVTGGTVALVECDADEAIGMALACGLGVAVERDVVEMAATTVAAREDEAVRSPTDDGEMPVVRILDEGFSIGAEGSSGGPPSDGASSPLRAPRTSTSLFDSFFASPPSPPSSSSPSPSFDANNPVRSLSEYDAMTVEDKAKTLLSLGSFEGKLPRPRTLREAEMRAVQPKDGRSTTTSGGNPLDELLLPLIDESVRRQFMIRDAEERGDVETARRLRSERSRRQVARERAEDLSREGNEESSEAWSREADFFGDLRADVTQDEGSYSRFLDKDDWYERDRLRRAERARKKSGGFGTLLDGIE